MLKIIFLLHLFLLSCYSSKTNEMDDNETVTVNFHKSICQGEAYQWCYQIKEKGAKDWEFYYDEIGGFKYEWGYNYILKVKKEKVKNPPQDASSEKWILESIIKKEKVKIGEIFTLKIAKELLKADLKNKKIEILGETFSIANNLINSTLKPITYLKFEFKNSGKFEIIEIN